MLFRYPTLERTLMCLSKLYRNIDAEIFEKIAQESVFACNETLKTASTIITNNQVKFCLNFIIYKLIFFFYY